MSGGHKTSRYLVPQVFGLAAYVSIEVRHVDELCDASLSGCLGNLLRDCHEDILITIVPSHKMKGKHLHVKARL